ncbi:MAG TPA: TraR/DksA C4-type zinc finger protein [Burkholderiales bacterium]|jgi:RNA polymerase-binding transcription factor DksA|nr:TraR/DksA C4-type zinc finger protein [Burkholderiales bacterium]
METTMHYHYFTLEQRANLESVIRSQMNGQPALAGALERLRTPDYGICVCCGAEIPYVRLMEFPAVELCSACQSES